MSVMRILCSTFRVVVHTKGDCVLLSWLPRIDFLKFMGCCVKWVCGGSVNVLWHC
jgi:hypothetical protein